MRGRIRNGATREEYMTTTQYDENRQALAQLNWQPPRLLQAGVTPQARQAALNRLARRSNP
jgi:hypothetical protein